jgi:hypothetical protein
MNRVFTVILSLLIICVVLLFVPASAAQTGCEPFKVPPGPEWGDFITNVWYTGGDIAIGGDTLRSAVTIYPTDDFPILLGKKGNVMKGTETALYDFGPAGSFRTDITFTVEHNNDPTKWTMTATEIVVPGSGTGRFAGVTGHFADHGSFWMTNWDTLEADGWFATHGMICDVAPAK